FHQLVFCPARARMTWSNTLAPRARSSGAVYSAMLWLSPFTDGTKIIDVGQTLASIWASWPAPLGMRRVEHPSSVATCSTRSTISVSNSTGSKPARDRVATGDPSAGAHTLRYAVLT